MVKRFLLPIFAAVLFAVLGNACHEDPVEPEPTLEPTVEGIYLGVIGFNDQLYVKDISLLKASTYTTFTTFIDNLAPRNNTALLYADYTALQKMNEYPSPPKLKNVALVTFTDGLDNVSTTLSGYNGSTSAYRDALHQKIMNEQIHGLNVSAYSIGLKGADVSDEAQFMETLKKLASSDNNVFQVANMDEAMARFSEIATSLYSTSTSVNLGVSVPGSIVEDGQHIRFTFDNVDAATNSNRYIEASFRYTSNNSRTLDNITYYGFAQGPTTIVSSASQGVSFQFQFENLTYADGNPVPQSDMNNIKLWKQTSTGGWDKETEFSPASSTTITEERNSALIVLVLDCTTSLGSDFTHMQESAKQFVRTLANVGGGNSPAKPTVTTSSVSNISETTATCGGNVSSDGGATVYARGVCWSTSQNPTVSDSHTTNGNGTGSFTSSLTGLTEGTTYYVRAYATNGAGTAYGNQVIFTSSLYGQPCPNAAVLTDIDNNTYNTVQIGQQCWMKENLRTTHYADGSSIPVGSDTSGTSPYYYNYSLSGIAWSSRGYLYNWPAVMHGSSSSSANPSGVQGICPNGWHVPSEAEWRQLRDYVRSQSAYRCEIPGNIAKALASTTGWNYSSNTCAVGNNQSSNNATGFSAVPAGYYDSHGLYGSGVEATFWSSTRVNIPGDAYYLCNLQNNIATVSIGYFIGSMGYSVRCLRD